MRKVIKYAKCNNCDNRLDMKDNAIEFLGELYCGKDCAFNDNEWRMDEVEIEEGHCTEEECDSE